MEESRDPEAELEMCRQILEGFGAADADGDGYLDRNEVKWLADRMLGGAHWSRARGSLGAIFGHPRTKAGVPARSARERVCARPWPHSRACAQARLLLGAFARTRANVFAPAS